VTELRPLFDTSEHEDERAWLRAARDESPSPSAMRDAALALGLTTLTANALAASVPVATPGLPALASSGAATSGASVSTAVGTASLGVLGKGLLGGALVSFLALTTLDHTLSSSSNPPALVSATTVRGATPSSVITPKLEQVRSSALELPVSPPTEVTTARRAAPRLPSSASVQALPPAVAEGPANAAFEPVSARPASAAPPLASLARETQLLDRARRALGAGALDEASRALSTYAASHPSPVLAVEAAQLQVRLLLARGDRAAAVALARGTIQSHPKSAHASLLRQLAAEP
jgi:hypothetical protein